MNKDKKLTPNTYLNTLKFIHSAMLLGILLFTIFIYATGEGLLADFSKDHNVFVYLVPTLAILSYFISNYVFGKQLKDLTKLNSLKSEQPRGKFTRHQAENLKNISTQASEHLKSHLVSKLVLYLQASVVRFSFIEGAAILGTIVFMLDNHIFYLVISLLLILYLFKLRPTNKKIIMDLELTLEDQQFFILPHPSR